MPDIKNIGVAAESVLALADKFKAVIEMAEALRGLQSVEQAINERNVALAVAKGEHEKALKDLKTVQDQGVALTKLQGDAARAHDKALNDNASKVLGDAGKKAAEIVKKAQDEADLTTSQAASDAARVKTASEVAQDAAQNRLETSTAAAADVEKKLAKLRADHDALAKSMADLRSAAQRLAS